MFCLRSWVFTLACLTNASPIYVFLFLTATYVLQRPCVYCSILLFVLVFSLYDFHADWFEPRWQSATSIAGPLLGWNATVADALDGAASIAMSALNGTASSVVGAGLDSARKRWVGGSDLGASASISGFEWLRNLVERRQFRIPCVDVLVRL